MKKILEMLFVQGEKNAKGLEVRIVYLLRPGGTGGYF